MGRQVMFYVSQKDANDLIRVIQENGGIIIHESGKELDENDLLHFTDYSYLHNKYYYVSCYIKVQDSEIKYDYYERINRLCLNDDKSEVINVWMHCKSNEVPNGIEWARFWHNPNNKKLDKVYNAAKKHIRKNFHICKDKSYYLGPDFYELYKQGKCIPVTITGIPIEVD